MSLNLREKNVFVLLLAIAVGGLLLFALKGLFSSLLGAIVVYTLFRPLLIWLTKKKKIRKLPATLIVLFLSFISIVIPLLLVIFMIINKVTAITNNPDEVVKMVEEANRWLGSFIHQPDFLKNLLKQGQAAILGFFADFVGTTFDFFLEVIIMYFLLFFMFLDHYSFESAAFRYSPFTPEHSKRFAQELKMSTYSNILGQGFIALVQGILQGIGFWIFDLPEPVFWGTITVGLSMLPMIGAPIVFVPASIFALTQGNNVGGIGMLIYGFVLVTNIDNVIRFAINKKMADIHPIITVLGVIVGIPLFGMLGIVFGPLLFSFFLLLIKIYQENKGEGIIIKQNVIKTSENEAG